MSRSMFSLPRVLGAVSLCAAAALPAVAQQVQADQDQPVQATNAMTVARDADTGKLRAATADEQATLHAVKAKSMVRMATPRPLPKVHSSGARGVRVTDDFFTASSLVAVRTADGKIAIAHGDPDSVAHGQAQVPAATTTTTPATE